VDNCFVIRNKEKLFWDNRDGWVGQVGDATLYTEQEMQSLSLPMGGEWEPFGSALLDMLWHYLPTVKGDETKRETGWGRKTKFGLIEAIRNIVRDK